MAWFHVTMDSLVEKTILVHVNNDMVYKFKEYEQVYIWILNTWINYQNPIPQKIVNEYAFFSTVSNDKEYFTRVEIEGADKAHDLQQILGRPSDQALITDLQGNQILN